MCLYVNATDWHHLSDTARTSISQMMREHHYLEDGQDMIPTINYLSLLDMTTPSLLDPDLATSLRLAVCAGLEACIIISYVVWHGEVTETCFVAANQESPSL